MFLEASRNLAIEGLMRTLEPGMLPYRVFLAIARIWVTTTVDILPIKEGSYPDTQVLLLNRGPKDLFWRNQLHAPGTVVRATDESYEDAFKRILEGEIKGIKVEEGPVFAGKPLLQHTERGTETVLLHWATISGEPKNGRFYPANDLPSTIIPKQLPRIDLALEHYKSSMTNR